MRTAIYTALTFLILFATGCVTQFIPDIEETRELLVVEGLLTNQANSTVKLSKSFPLGEKGKSLPLSGCSVWITDDLQNSYNLPETSKGTYTMYAAGEVGRKYTLHVRTNNSYVNGYSFESLPVEMLPVPVVDTVYYKKIAIQAEGPFNNIPDVCQIYLDTKDQTGRCRFYRWDFTETWEIRLPFDKALNPLCWVTEVSKEINVKSTAGLSEAEIRQYPLHYITNESDRLKEKYSMLINQYSLTEEEFLYWDKLRAVTQDVGSLYDITPASIPNNIHCVENPAEKVLGYFSVSAKSSKRIFIKDYFREQPNFYHDCIHDTIFGNYPVIPHLNESVWILDYNYGPGANPPFTSITYTRGCSDCTVRGTKIKPPFWR